MLPQRARGVDLPVEPAVAGRGGEEQLGLLAQQLLEVQRLSVPGKKLTSTWNGREITSVASKDVTKSWSVECEPISNSKPTVDIGRRKPPRR